MAGMKKDDNNNEYELNQDEKIEQDIELENENMEAEDLDNEEYDSDEDYQENKKKSKKKFLWLLLIPILAVVGFFVHKKLSDPGEVSVTDYEFSEKYELKDGIYVFDEGKDVELTITLEGSKSGKIDERKVSYALDDSSICMYRKLDYNQCELIGLSKGNTTIHVYYGGNKIDSINIGFDDLDGDKSEENIIGIDKIEAINMEKQGSGYVVKIGKDAEMRVILKGNNADNAKLSYSIDDTSLANISGNQDTCKISGKEEGSTTLRILYNREELYNINLIVEKADGEDSDSNNAVDAVVAGYLNNYAQAVNSGDISSIKDYITQTGELYNELTQTLPQDLQNNKKINIINYTKDSMKAENGKYKVGITLQYNITEGETTKNRKEYMEFIVVQESGQWLIDKIENRQIKEESQAQ